MPTRTTARSRAATYLSSRVRFGIKFGLETMRALCEELHHPERAFESLLVAGTNGKGSVVAYADSVLRASGLRVGRYTSPHLVHVGERIAVAVLEVGMGARLDATNVVDPLCSAIVTIDRDHEAHLGTTLAAIAREKAGVLR